MRLKERKTMDRPRLLHPVGTTRSPQGSLWLLGGREQNHLSTIIAPSVLFTQGFATSGLLTKIHKSTILVPTLQSHWLVMHVSMMILSYAALLCGSLFSVAILVIIVCKVIQIVGKSNNLYFLNKLFYFAEIKYINLNERNNVLQKTSFFLLEIIISLNLFNNHIIGLGFIFLTIDIFSGAVWSNEAWGSYRNWDPKVTWAFITWTIFAIYLHTRKKNWDV
ncbi:putative cytochrome c assembly protein [Lupinus albus]|uniref:Putative cytochrome c assembly protein n=1 Tax=Lupinus albus TaxID=3870 RepID=A0A6A4N9L3_LUPAL|nr:putative cytochrome c assembly protein [Lupinus albus]